MKRRSLTIDRRRRAVTVDGHTTILQEKSWQVLDRLLARAPGVVTRADIIDSIWQGNFRSGDKGLNQAIWAIRAALDEDAREPEFIRTVPRVGYQWIFRHASTRTWKQRMTSRNGARLSVASAVYAAAATAVVAAIGYMVWTTALEAAEPASGFAGRVAMRAYLVDRDVHVEFAGGCLGILKNDSGKNIGAPILSADGTEVAVTVHEEGGCRLVTVDVQSGKRQEFGSCPAS